MATFNKTYNDTTILIPSKGRSEQLAALLGYFERSHTPYKIIILESGNVYHDIIGMYRNLDIELHEFDPASALASKLLAGVHLIKTPFVCICTDDDLVLKESIEESAAFLKMHLEYSACQGYHARFDQQNLDIYLHDFLWFTPSIESSDPLQRLHALITRYQPICWAVFRTDVLMRMYKEFTTIQSPLFFELFWSATAVLVGKVKRIPTLYCLRKNDEIQTAGHPMYLFAESPDGFFSDYLAYRACLEKILYRNGQSLAELRRILDLMHSCLFYDAAERGIMRYITLKALEDPAASILNPKIYPSIKMPLPRFQQENSVLIQRGKVRYHFSNQFLNPTPQDEILVPAHFHLQLIDDLEKFVI